MSQCSNKTLVSALAKRWLGSAVMLLVLPFLTGCWVQSVYPFYEDSDVIVDNTLAGEWIGEGELKNCLLTISLELSVKIYSIAAKPTVAGSEAHSDCDSGTLKARLAQVGQQRFVDIVPDGDNSWTPLDMILKLDTYKQHLALTPLDAEWIADAITRKSAKLQGRIGGAADSFPVGWMTVTLVSSTSDLREFLRQHADDKRAFSETGRMEFRRNGTQP